MPADQAKKQVRQFYDEVGWKQSGQLQFQNAQFEDLRPVSSEYINRCHLRVNRFINPTGRFLLDAGSGPVQYPEYLTYSSGYQFRVCLDISLTALLAAREKLKEHGLYVLADAADLPFKKDAFDGIVSLHTFHHLVLDDQMKAYHEVFRVLNYNSRAVVVNGWKTSPLMKRFDRLMAFMERSRQQNEIPIDKDSKSEQVEPVKKPDRTFVDELDAQALKQKLAGDVPLDIRVWRSVNVRFLRAFIKPSSGGRIWLRIIYWLEELFPHYLGEKGAYPLVVVSKN
jgi:SAM-dependent methyltransferase